jgi:hypothetical protein
MRTAWRNVAVALLALPLGIAAGSIRAAEPFTVVAVGDCQYYSTSPPPNNFSRLTAWIADQKGAMNIVFMTQVGDITDDGSIADQWTWVTEGISILNGNIPYSVTFGNHDLMPENPDSVAHCLAFGTPIHEGGATYGGTSPDGLSFYQTFSAEGFNFLHLNVRNDPDGETLSWANGVIDANPNLPTILTTHSYLIVPSPPTDPDTMTVGERNQVGNVIWNGLVKDNPEIFLVLCGHNHDVALLLSANAAGQQVAQMMCDFGPACVRILAFDPQNGQIRVKDIATPTKYEDAVELTGADNNFVLNAQFDTVANRIGIVSLNAP